MKLKLLHMYIVQTVFILKKDSMNVDCIRSNIGKTSNCTYLFLIINNYKWEGTVGMQRLGRIDESFLTLLCI